MSDDLERVDLMTDSRTTAEKKHGQWRVRVSITLTGVNAVTIISSQEHRGKTFQEATAKAQAEVEALGEEIGATA